MKKSLFTIMAAIGFCAMVTACGGSSDSSGESSSNETTESADQTLKVKPETTNVGGKWGKAFDFEDKEYYLKVEEGWGGDHKVAVKIAFTRNSNTPDVNFTQMAGSHEATNKYVADMEAEFFDEEGESLFTANVRLCNYDDINKLLNLCEGDKTTVTFSTYGPLETIQRARTFRITSTMELNSEYGGGTDPTIQDVDETMDAAANALNAVGTMMGAAADAANAASELSKRK